MQVTALYHNLTPKPNESIEDEGEDREDEQL